MGKMLLTLTSLGIALLCIVVAYFSISPDYFNWVRWSLWTLYLIPLLGVFVRHATGRAIATWWGVFLILHSVISFYWADHTTRLRPHLRERIDVQAGLSGIRGLQQITTDAEGFRSLPPVSYETKTRPRVFALGASTTEELYLDDKKTWTHLLQQKLEDKMRRPIEVVNASISGVRQGQIYENFRYILRFKPDLVIFLVGVNDWNADIRNHLLPNRPLLTWTRQKILLGNTLVGRLLKNLFQPSDLSTTTEPRVELGEYYTKQSNSLTRDKVLSYVPTELSPEYQLYLEKTADLCKKAKVTCLFLTQPNQYKPNVEESSKKTFWMTPPNASYTLILNDMTTIARFYNEALIAFAKRQEIAVCDVDSKIPASLKYFYDDAHFNEAGARLVAQSVMDCLEDLPLQKIF